MKKDKQKKKRHAAAPSDEMTRKEFEKELAKLQVELVRLQTWVQAKKARIIVVFEGRDTAGKGGVISRITARKVRVSIGIWRCPHPLTAKKRRSTSSATWRNSRRGRNHLFDRSWYNRAGVERVIGFCTDAQYERFLELAPVVERK